MELSAELKTSLTKTSRAGKIEALRKEFALLSELMLKAAKHFGPPPGATLYQLWCPMAFDNRGATWLQSSEDVHNPYFGSVMLKCGDVVDVIAAVEPEHRGDAGDE